MIAPRFRIFVLIAAGLVLAGAGAWADGQGESATEAAAGMGVDLADVSMPFDETLELTMLGPKYWWPSGTQLLWIDVQDALNVQLTFNEVPYPEKKQITLAMGNIPDLAQVTASESFEYGTVGGFLNLADYLDWMPNLRGWLDRYEQYRFAYTLLDGSLYMAPKFSTQNDKDIQWGYNEDQLVERSGLPVPGSLEELAEVATQFRDMEPDIYPIVGLYWPGIANGANTALQATLNSMGIGDIDINYFRDEDQFLYTALHPRFKEAVEYVKGLYDEKLISQTYITENYRDWQKLFEAAPNKDGRHTLAPFSAYQINRHANILRWHEWSVNGLREQWWPEVYPLFLGDGISLPLAQPLSGSSLDPDGLAVSKALESDPTKLAKTLAFVDWLYSEEGVRWINYGQEGEHYDLVGGEVDVRPEYTGNTPEFYERDGRWNAARDRDDVKGDVTKITPEEKREIQYYSLYQVWPRWALYQIHVFDGDTQRWPSPAFAHTTAKIAELEQDSNVIGKFPLPFTVDEQRKVADLKTSTLDTVLENVDLFITGRRPMDEWDAFIKEVKSAGATDLEVIYNRTYNFKVKR